MITADQIPDVVEFSIPKFSEYNPRRDVQRSSWFRLDSSWYVEVTKKGLSWSVASLWPVCIGVVAGTKAESAKIDIKWLSRTLKTKTPMIKKAFADLANHKMIVIHNQSVTRTCSTNERTNERNEQDETEKKPAKAADAAPRPKGPSPSDLVEVWNQNRGPLPEVTKLNKTRYSKAKVRLNEEPDLGYWERVAKTIAETPFLRGENDRGWKADFDWLIANDANHVKVSEGKYGGGSQTITAESELERLEARFQAAREERI